MGKKEGQLPESNRLFPAWLVSSMQQQKIVLWGIADLRKFATPKDSNGRGFPSALSYAIPMTPAIMAGIQHGPNQAYADEYTRVNNLINDTAAELTAEFKNRGYRAQALAASERTDPVNIKGDFPQKTAATRAGLGWIGRHCQLITRKFGSWVRLGTVFTDMELPCGSPAERSFCGTCMRCVEACPAGAEYGKRNYNIHVAIAPTKNINRFEWFLEKSTEIGIDEITPMICQRSERKVVKPERLNKVITSAMKQSVKAYHPVLSEATTFKDLISRKHAGEKYIAYIEEGTHPSLKSLYTPGKDAIILIGPEGDFSPEEVLMATDMGFKTVSLGTSRLRTETAGVVVCHTLALMNSE